MEDYARVNIHMTKTALDAPILMRIINRESENIGVHIARNSQDHFFVDARRLQNLPVLITDAFNCRSLRSTTLLPGHNFPCSQDPWLLDQLSQAFHQHPFRRRFFGRNKRWYGCLFRLSPAQLIFVDTYYLYDLPYQWQPNVYCLVHSVIPPFPPGSLSYPLPPPPPEDDYDTLLDTPASPDDPPAADDHDAAPDPRGDSGYSDM